MHVLINSIYDSTNSGLSNLKHIRTAAPVRCSCAVDQHL